MTRVIDFHVHVGDFFRLRDDIQTLLVKYKEQQDFDIFNLFNNPNGLGDYLTSQGVWRGVILAEEGPGTNYHINNDFVAEYKEKSGSDVLIPFGSINPNTGIKPMNTFKNAIAKGLQGFKLYPADHDFDPVSVKLMEVYALMEEMQLPLMFHTGATAQRDGNSEYCDPQVFEPILKSFPSLPVVFAHSGRPQYYREAEYMARTYENCYLETALLSAEQLIANFPDLEAFSEKIIFGSDWPGVKSLSQHVNEFLSSSLSHAAIENIMYNNAARLLKITDLSKVR